VIDWSTISLEELAGYISEELRTRGIDTILVGGACVTIYSCNHYQSYDLDYVTYEDMRKVKKALKEIGFTEKGKYFQRAECPWFIEFVSPPVAVGEEPIRQFHNVVTQRGTITLLRPVDSVKDRLASFYHWSDKQGLEQAVSICMEQDIDMNEIERWSNLEKQSDKFLVFKELLEKKKQ
jgi:hypothetical protein